MTRPPRFQKTGKGSFFGDFLYERVIPKDHFLRALQEMFNWEEMSNDLISIYKGRGMRGRPPYDPALIFKFLFISYLYDTSERDVERLATYHLAVKWFLGLAVDEPAPDHSTITKFKNRFLEGDNWKKLGHIFDEMIGQARAHGLQMGDIQLLDSVHTQANVNKDKDSKRQEKGKEPRDADARVVNKGKREVVGADGRRVKRAIRYRGYKTHASVNSKTRIVTSIQPARGNTADNKAFPYLFEHDQSMELPTTTYGGDKAYDDTDIFERLESQGMSVGICLRTTRTSKKDANTQRWEALKATPQYQAATKVRYRVEQPFGQAKDKHGFERCRYIGLARYAIQSFLTFMVINCKRLIKLLTGLTFRPLAKGKRAEVFKPVYTSLPWA